MIFLLFIINQHVDYQDLYNKATTSLVKFQVVKDSAFQRFVQLAQDTLIGEGTINFLISKFDTKSAAERHTLKDILIKIGKSAIKCIVRKIDYRGSDEEARSLKQSLWVLGEIGGDEIVETTSRFLNDVEWQIRSNAYTTLGKSRSKNALQYVIQGLKDSIPIVRKCAYYALSQIATKKEIPHLIEGLDDEFYGVRYACVEGLKNIGRPATRFLLKEISNNEFKNYFIVLTLREIGEKGKLKMFVKSNFPPVRFNVYQGIEDKKFLQEILKKEEYPILKTKLLTFLKK